MSWYDERMKIDWNEGWHVRIIAQSTDQTCLLLHTGYLKWGEVSCWQINQTIWTIPFAHLSSPWLKPIWTFSKHAYMKLLGGGVLLWVSSTRPMWLSVSVKLERQILDLKKQSFSRFLPFSGYASHQKLYPGRGASICKVGNTDLLKSHCGYCNV